MMHRSDLCCLPTRPAYLTFALIASMLLDEKLRIFNLSVATKCWKTVSAHVCVDYIMSGFRGDDYGIISNYK